MLQIEGYAVEGLVHEGQRSAIYRGVRASDGRAVVLKVPRAPFLDLAIALAESLDSLHGQDLVHRDIRPANILVQPDLRKVRLCDLSAAAPLGAGGPPARPDRSEGGLAYISPEQTGRTDWPLD